MTDARPKPRGRALAALIVAALILGIAAVAVARGLRSTDGIRSFLDTYPGTATLPEWAPSGFPAWLSWQHFLSAFLLLFVVRSGLLVRGKQRPPAFWTRDPARFPRTSRTPRRLSLHAWWHLVVDTLWLANGLVYVVLLVASGRWVRIVPTSWDVIPNAASAALQYVSLDWPTESSWTAYNALQLLSYFATVFVAAPLAVLTGLRLSPFWIARPWAERRFPERRARQLHWAVTVYFIAFTTTHVFLVLTTGARRNLNYMYAGRNDDTAFGVAVFLLSLVVTVVAAVVFRPPTQAAIAERTGRVRRMPPV
ncbi:MAG: cytochrome b/b6 domain-containing protein [Micrococcales bacterium]|nr:cytochrome b/b6 domain-containing protein [Micrococcales bacterium]